MKPPAPVTSTRCPFTRWPSSDCGRCGRVGEATLLVEHVADALRERDRGAPAGQLGEPAGSPTMNGGSMSRMSSGACCTSTAARAAAHSSSMRSAEHHRPAGADVDGPRRRRLEHERQVRGRDVADVEHVAHDVEAPGAHRTAAGALGGHDLRRPVGDGGARGLAGTDVVEAPRPDDAHAAGQWRREHEPLERGLRDAVGGHRARAGRPRAARARCPSRTGRRSRPRAPAHRGPRARPRARRRTSSSRRRSPRSRRRRGAGPTSRRGG